MLNLGLGVHENGILLCHIHKWKLLVVVSWFQSSVSSLAVVLEDSRGTSDSESVWHRRLTSARTQEKLYSTMTFISLFPLGKYSIQWTQCPTNCWYETLPGNIYPSELLLLLTFQHSTFPLCIALINKCLFHKTLWNKTDNTFGNNMQLPCIISLTSLCTHTTTHKRSVVCFLWSLGNCGVDETSETLRLCGFHVLVVSVNHLIRSDSYSCHCRHSCRVWQGENVSVQVLICSHFHTNYLW